MESSGGPRAFAIPASLTSFIGREREVSEIRSLLLRPGVRLVTLTGPGGVGKTRLAMQVAIELAPFFDRKSLFVGLAPVEQPNLVSSEIGRAFGIPDAGEEALADRINIALDGQSQLVVIDNFERLVEAAPVLVRLLSACPDLKILTTSRVVLHLSGEHEYRVGPLDIAEPTAAEVLSASRLFLERSELNTLEQSTEDMFNVAEICRRLDGLPLAIELAAAKTRVFSLDELLHRLDRRLSLLTEGPRDAPTRLRSMRDAIGWSYEMLTEDERALFRSLSVFEGGFSLSAAEGVCPRQLRASPVEGLARLIDQSLVIRVPGEQGNNRLRMLETIREFGLEQLDVSGEEAVIRDRHLDWFIVTLGSPGSEVWIDLHAGRALLLPDDEHNLRAALMWALDHSNAVSAAQIAWGLLPFWRRNGFFHEGATCLGRVVDKLGPLDKNFSAGLMSRAADLWLQIGDLSRATALSIAALDTFREMGSPTGVRTSLLVLALATRWTDHLAAIEMLSEAATISLALGNIPFYAAVLRSRAVVHLLHGDLASAADDVAECLPLLRQAFRTHSSLAFALGTAGWLAGLQGELETADQLAGEALTMSIDLHIVECQLLSRRVLGHVALQRRQFQVALDYFRAGYLIVYRSAMHMWDGFNLVEFAHVAASQGNQTQAARLYGAADASWKRLGIPTPARALAGWSGPMAIDPQELADPQIQSAYGAGQQLTWAEAYAEAMSVEIVAGTDDRAGSILSSREHQVLLLIAEGQTNREIAENLFVSKRTVDSHVLSILAKLGVDSRRKAVMTARQQGLLES